MEIRELKHLVGVYGTSYPSDEELLQLITGKKKIDSFTKDCLEEYSRRTNFNGVKMSRPYDAVQFLKSYQFYEQEHFGVVMLNGAHEIIKIKDLFTGTVNKAITHPRDVFRECIKENASACIVFHNHPSGLTSPSADDVNTTEVMVKAGNVIGIPVLDHIIIGNGYYSFAETKPETLKEV